jgi:hypothetical protein
MIRLHCVVEGQTEEEFVNAVLAEHLGRFGISADVRRVETSRQRARYRSGRTVPPKIFRGGLSSYSKARKDLDFWMKEDQNPDARFTTMFDLYALPSDFPAYEQASRAVDPRQRVETLERAVAADITDRRFVPYIQLHEFEALVLAEPLALASEFPGREVAVGRLDALARQYDNPELIDDGEQTAPSKRIMSEIPEYEGRKASAGPLVVAKIGLGKLRLKCPHFAGWLAKLEGLVATVGAA